MRWNDEAYFMWLCETLDSNAHDDDGYLLLCEQMHGIEFVPVLSDDENRAKFGIETRMQYGGYADAPSDPCSFMELIFSLCEVMATLAYDPDRNYTRRFWFRELLRNTGLYMFTNMEYHENERSRAKVDDIIKRISLRTYRSNGHGGFFPMVESREDQRNVPLWMQMNSYLIERLS